MKNTKDFKTGLIYKYTSPNGKVYIGQTINEASRKNYHKRASKGLSPETYFANALKKYGYENFKYEVIIKFNPTVDIEKLKRVLDKLEKRYIKIYQSDNRKYGYNLNEGGGGNVGYKHTPEMIEYLKSLPKTEEQLKNLSIGKHDPKSEETKNKLREAHRSRMKKVGKFNLQLELIEEFESIEAAARSINGSTQKTKAKKISRCCNEGTGTAYSYVWLFITSP